LIIRLKQVNLFLIFFNILKALILFISTIQIDLNHFSTFKLNTILFNHINEFYSCVESHPDLFYDEAGWKNASLEEKLAKQDEILKRMLKENENSVHYALSSRQHELTYLRHTSKQILTFLLPEDVLKCRQVAIGFHWI
jgi:hypothetical protein